MTRRVDLARDRRGSALLISLVLIFVMAMLGLALFQLGVVESRLVYTSEDDVRALQVAQAGVERALAQLQQDIVNSGAPLWASGSPAMCSGGSHRGCSDSRFYPVASGFISNVNFDTGSYAVEFKQATAKTYPVPCTASTVVSDVDSTKFICNDLVFVRATGTLAKSREGYSATRTIQLLAQASLTPGKCLICGGLTGAAATGLPINGNVNIAGSILIAGVDGTISLSLGGGSTQTNSYALLSDAVSLASIAPLPLVCPLGRTCSSTSGLVESLGATLKVAHPVDIPAVSLNGTAQLGQNGDQTYAADSTRTGKGPLDAIDVANGCVMPCTGEFTNVTLNSNVFVDDNNITKPFPSTTAPFPQLTDSWAVDGVTYTHLACVQGSSCTPPGSPTTEEYFVSRAANLMTLPSANCVANPMGCGQAWSPGFSGPAGPITFLSGCPTGCPPHGTAITGLGDGPTPGPFEISVTFIDKTGTIVNGKICWDRANPSRPDGVSAPRASQLPPLTLEFGSPNCDAPSSVDNPLLLYIPSSYPTKTGLTINRNGGPSNYYVRGSALTMTNGLVQIEETVYSCQTTANPSACYNSQGNGGPDLFTRDSSFTVMTIGNLNLGKNTSGISSIMGLFYTGCDPTDSACGTTEGVLTSQKQTNILGVALGYRLCFAGGTAPCSSGGNVPSFFQVMLDKNNLLAKIGKTSVGSSYTVAPWPPYWVECQHNADGTLVKDPATDLCYYTPSGRST